MKIPNLFLPKSHIIIEKGNYYNGVSRVKCKDGLYHYINEKGRFLFKNGFYRAEEFSSTCAIADDNLLKCDGQILLTGDIERLKGMESLFVIYQHRYHDDKCALVSSDGNILTGYDYSRISVAKDGSIQAYFIKNEYSPIKLGSVINKEYIWWCKLDSTGAEITPRLSFDKQMVNDTLCTCRVYKGRSYSYCLYNIEDNSIIRTDVQYLPETKQYRLLKQIDLSLFRDEEEYNNPKYGIIDLNFKEVIPAQFDSIIPSTCPHRKTPYLIGEFPEGPFAETRLYIVKAYEQYGLYDNNGNCYIEPCYKDIQSSSNRYFLLESDKGIYFYDNEDDRKIRVLIEHELTPPTEKNKLVFYNKRYEIFRRKDGSYFFTIFKDPKNGHLGIVDDRMRVLLPSDYVSIDYNSLSNTVKAILPSRVEEYTLEQLEQGWSETKPFIHITHFPELVTEEDYNLQALEDGYNKVLFVDTETNGLPRDFIKPVTDTDNWPRLVQISWVITNSDCNALKRRAYYIRPEGFHVKSSVLNPCAIPEETLIKEGVPLFDALKEFSDDLVSVDLVVGHNIRFDKSVIQAELIRLSLPDAFEGKRTYCTMIGSKSLCQIIGRHGFKYPKLQEFYHYIFNKDFEGAHDASNDVEATLKCFHWLTTPDYTE